MLTADTRRYGGSPSRRERTARPRRAARARRRAAARPVARTAAPEERKEGTVRLWDADSGAETARLEGYGDPVAVRCRPFLLPSIARCSIRQGQALRAARCAVPDQILRATP